MTVSFRKPGFHDVIALTSAQRKALAYAADEREGDGCVFAGRSVTRRGSVFEVAASTIRALERRGLVTTSISPDGGVMATITDAGRAALAEVSS